MGFMDKLKNAGKSALKGAAYLSTVKYGKVSDGEYKGCQIAMNDKHDGIVFVKVVNEEGRLAFSDVESFEISSFKETVYPVVFNLKNGEKLNFTMMEKPVGNDAPLSARYRDMAKFVTALEKHIKTTDKTQVIVNTTKAYVK